MRYLQLNDIDAYKRALALSNYVWNVVIKWEWFAKRTVGAQWVEATDSISALIGEGFGRYFKKDKVNFYRMARGSVLESGDWTKKSQVRRLISQREYEHVIAELEELPREINQLIGYTNKKLRQ